MPLRAFFSSTTTMLTNNQQAHPPTPFPTHPLSSPPPQKPASASELPFASVRLLFQSTPRSTNRLSVLAITILILLLRRRKPQPQPFYPPPHSNPNFPSDNPPAFPTGPMPTPFSGNGHGPYTPPPPMLKQPIPIPIPQNQAHIQGDVSPIDEKAIPAVTVSRKEVGSGLSPEASSPTLAPATPATTTRDKPGPTEVDSTAPPPRHEISSDGQMANTATTRAQELDGSLQLGSQYPSQGHYPGQGQYTQSVQDPWSYNYPGAQEVDGGQDHWANQQRTELPGGRYQSYQGQQYGGAYELGPGR